MNVKTLVQHVLIPAIIQMVVTFVHVRLVTSYTIMAITAQVINVKT